MSDTRTHIITNTSGSLGEEVDDVNLLRRVDKDADLLIGRPPSDKSKSPMTAQTIALLVLMVLAVLYTLYAAAAVIFPMVLASLIALPLRSSVQWLAQKRVPRLAGATLVIAVLLVVVGAALAWVTEPAAHWIKESPANLRLVEQKLRSLGTGPWNDVQEATAEVDRITKTAEDPATLSVQVKQPSWTSRALNATSELIVGAVICLSLVFLLLAFGDRLLDNVVSMCPPGWNQRNLRTMFERVESMMSRYLLTYLVINIALGIVIGTGLWLMGMPNPMLWGAMAACLNFIPFVGQAVGTIVVTLVAILTFDSISYAMLAPTIYLVANGVEANIISPALLGRSLRLNVIMIFVSIALWGWIWGIGGVLIAVPLLATLKIACDHLEPIQPLGRLLAE